MTAAYRCLIAAAISAGIALGQQKPKDSPPLVTVCQVFGNLNRYVDKAIAVVGRMERSISLIDHYEFLSQDGCASSAGGQAGHSIQKIEISTDWEEGMPRPPSNRPELNKTEIAKALSLARKGTKLGTHDEPQIRADGGSTTYRGVIAVPNYWAVVYGRIVKAPNSDELYLVIVAEPDEVRRIGVTGAFLSDDQ